LFFLMWKTKKLILSGFLKIFIFARPIFETLSLLRFFFICRLI
jgi:hypothetical protein